MITYGQGFDDERAQIVPTGVFSGCEFAQQPSPPTFNGNYDYGHVFVNSASNCYDDFDAGLLDDGQVPFCGGYQQQRVNHLGYNQQQRNVYDSQNFDYISIKPEPKTLLECLNANTGSVSCSTNSVPRRSTAAPVYTMPQQPAHPVPQETQQDMGFSLARDKIEQVQQLAIRQAIADMQSACKILQIPAEPFFWTKEQTRAWLIWTCQHYNLSHCIDLRQFDFDGFHLVMLQESDFKRLAPVCGEFLWSILDIWRTAAGGNSIKTETDIGGYGCQPQRGQPMSASPVDYTNNAVSIDQYSTYGCVTSFDGPYSNCTMTSAMSISAGSPGSCGESCGNDSGFENETISEDDRSSMDGDMDHNMDSTSGGSHTHLWQFLKELLGKPHIYSSAIRWVDRSKGIFKIEDSVRVARCWGKRKNRPAMNYDKLSRSIRQYYKKGIMKKTERSQRLVYQFCPAYAH
ncbi:DNA-binding protein D-ETS-4-like [Paramacrobiotus metropolitanus]|uniref:DNA-binding protein D-ETS-4-like n=1 Tax=Paramacrobiotus metropolitanus TaxID=2943436 RepID=UPI002445CCB8|nr:DNA-binding protein D-ETS-4-like [Paramacrobiotus metropolitanus]